MTEAWTGRKYLGKLTGSIYEIPAEPFWSDGLEYVPYRHAESGVHGCERVEFFENSDSYERLIEPKYTVGDKVRNYLNVIRIIAVASEADRDGDFAYLYKDDDGNVDLVWEGDIEGKVSE
ncbi:hypothetical protein [Kitasatospora aureofaciens]|uniref:hypothetical protein n=1 Tax=Kitasatospora aureofaciens TaxID=1894 RepID=UPI0033D58BCA